MRTERIGDDRGKITGMRVIDANPDYTKCEYDFTEKGTLLGIDYEAVGTYWSIQRRDGTEYGEGKAIMTTRDGEIVTYRVSGTGHSTGNVGGDFKATIYCSTNSGNVILRRLCNAPILAEYKSDREGNTETVYYEWKE